VSVPWKAFLIKFEQTSHRALKRACYTVRFMLSDNKAIRDHMYYNKGRVTIIGRHQQVPWVSDVTVVFG